MITFKCKMCGGDLTFEPGASVAECPYCGTNQTLPKLDDDKRANLYDRANHFRRQNEFDKAMAIYEQILAEDRTDAEAYWSLVLCRYGIEYVEDPASHKRVPTVNRVQYASILADEDYKSALAHADAAQRRVYETEANTIAEIQKGILDISRKEEPFDVFICYKETDANGRRTPDSVLANDMYHQLTKEGFKVFFSRITLEDKIGTAYEPYIFAALNSAKVMVVLGTKPEYFNAVWVKNEWSRYLALIRNGADKTLVPAYRDMDPYDLPEEFAHLQAQDMGKLGFMQDLIRGIKKILHKDEPKPQTAAQPAAAAPANNVAPLLKRAFMFLEDGDFVKADNFCEQVLNIDPENGRAYLGKLMSQLKVRREADLRNVPQPFDREKHYEKIMRFSDDALKKQLEDDIQFIKNRNEYNRQKGIFDKAVETLQKAQTVDACVEAMREFNTIPGFDGVQQQLAACTTKIEQINQANYQSAESMMRNGKYNDAIRAFQVLQGYRDSREKILECEECIRSEAYTRAKDWQDKEQWDDAASAFEKLGDYRDSQQQAKNCLEAKAAEQKAEEDRRERERQQAETHAKLEAAKKRKNTIIVIALIALAIVVGVLYIKVIKPNSTYNTAMKAMNEGNYDEATQLFDSLGTYKDASTQAQESQYQKGNLQMANGDYDGASTTFDSIIDYRDSSELFAEAAYCSVKEHLDNKDVLYAGMLLPRIANYKDSINLIHETQEIRSNYRSRVVCFGDNVVCLLNDGTVTTVCEGETIYADFSEELSTWKDIVAIAAGDTLFGLRSDGTIEMLYDKDYDDVSNWHDIIAIDASSTHLVGLKADGTVMATGYNGAGACDVENWKDIQSIVTGWNRTVGIKKDGSTVCAGSVEYNSSYGQNGRPNADGWKDIVSVVPIKSDTFGLKSDGTVIAGKNPDRVAEWKNIVALAGDKDGSCIVGLTADGTVVSAGIGNWSDKSWKEWTDIVAVDAVFEHIIGVKSDGTVLASGDENTECYDVTGWDSIIAVTTESYRTAGIRSDGSVLVTKSPWKEDEKQRSINLLEDK
ncbi:MAG: TIR domain-containing protein [Clostridia bacterium]|nr:TIR domain-containing protein [Clostridia bacterium]